MSTAISISLIVSIIVVLPVVIVSLRRRSNRHKYQRWFAEDAQRMRRGL